MNEFELLKIFCAAAEARNFKDAAARLGVSPQVVTRAVKHLEERLGETLFHRSTRQVRITAYGEQLARQGSSILSTTTDILRPATKRERAEVAGTVRVAAPSALGRMLVMRELGETLASHPRLMVDLRLSESVANAVDERIDVGIRIGALRDTRFVARQVARISFHVVAAPSLVARTGLPGSVLQLQSMPYTAWINSNSGRPWPWQFRQSRTFTSDSEPAFVTDDPEAEVQAALLGVGYAQLPNYLVRQHIRAGTLVEVLANDAPPSWPVSVYRSSRSPVPPRIKVVFDRLVSALGSADEFGP
jgi:DNA-binding transcriptional LysR family regulator